LKKALLTAGVILNVPTLAFADEQALLRRIEALEAKMGEVVVENKQLRAELKKTGVRREKAIVSAPTPVPVAGTLPVVVAQPNKSNAIWQGFYGGINGGYGANTNMRNSTNMAGFINSTLYNSYYFPPFASSEDTYFAGGSAGLQFGYNQMLTDRIMLGMETDINWANIYNQNTAYNRSDMSVFYNSTYVYPSGQRWYPAIAQYNSAYSQTALEAVGSTRFRLGYASGAFMPYVTGGVAYGMVSSEQKSTNVWGAVANANISGYTPPPYSSESSYSYRINAGFAAGTGFEYLMTDNWSTKFEYLYTSIGQINFKETTDVYNQFAVHQARIGLNYHLNTSDVFK
jgi:opacity protein-like surface antigen